MEKIYLVGNTHFDPIWLWTWDEAFASIRATFRSALDRMNEDPDFKYSFSCPPVFEWVRKTDPKLFYDIKARIADGRWRVDEGMWLQADLYSACGESYVRQCLHGQRYLMENFGLYSDTAFSADSFGHSQMLPQIFKKSRIPYCVIGRPDGADLPLSDPLFQWFSPDGSSILTARINDVFGGWSTSLAPQLDIALKRSEELGHPIMLVFGVTDHGGAPTKRDIATIRQYMEKYPGKVEFSGTSEYFENFTEKDGAPLTKIDGELMIRFFGPFCNCPEVKTENRRAEYNLYNAEKASVFAKILANHPYPLEKLTESCRDMLFCQFHDILGGASIPEAYVDVRDMHGRALSTAKEELTFSLQSIIKNIAMPRSDDVFWNLAVFNFNPYDYSGAIEAEIQWVWEFDFYYGDISITDGDGNQYAVQKLSAQSAIPGFRTRFVFSADIPAFGYKVFRVRRETSNIKTPGLLSVSLDEGGESGHFENDRLTGEFDGRGITLLTDKLTGRTLGSCGIPFALGDDSDVWAFNFNKWGDERGFISKSVKIVENGELRVKLRLKAVLGESIFEQDITIYRGSGKVECRYRVDWNEKQTTLKLRFAKSCGDRLTASTPYGYVTRPCDGKEKPVGEWLDISGEENGYYLALDGMYGYSSDENDAAPTILRSPIVGDLRISPLDFEHEDYRYLGQGVSKGGWKLAFHSKFEASKAAALGMELNNPVSVTDESNHGDAETADAALPMSDTLLSVENSEAIMLTALKAAENDESALVFRMVNMTDSVQTSALSICRTMRSKPLSFSPFEIKTLRLDGDGQFYETNMLEEKND